MACRSILLFTEAKSWGKSDWSVRQLFVGHMVGSWSLKKEKNLHWMIKTLFYFNILPNVVSCIFYYFISCRYPFVLWYDSTLNTLYMLLVSQSQRWGSNFWGENSENSPCYFQWPHPCQYDDMIFTSKASTSASLSVLFYCWKWLQSAQIRRIRNFFFLS